MTNTRPVPSESGHDTVSMGRARIGPPFRHSGLAEDSESAQRLHPPWASEPNGRPACQRIFCQYLSSRKERASRPSQSPRLDPGATWAERLEYWQRRAFREWSMRPGPAWTYLKMLTDPNTWRSALEVGRQHLGWT